jgi:hypothetical protein
MSQGSKRADGKKGLHPDIGKRVRSVNTGDVGVILSVGENGPGRVLMERSGEKWPYYPHEWIPLDVSSTKVAPQVGSRVRYEVDRLMLDAMGTRIPSWDELRDRERIQWNRAEESHVHDGPKAEARAVVMLALNRAFFGEEPSAQLE